MSAAARGFSLLATLAILAAPPAAWSQEWRASARVGRVSYKALPPAPPPARPPCSAWAAPRCATGSACRPRSRWATTRSGRCSAGGSAWRPGAPPGCCSISLATDSSSGRARPAPERRRRARCPSFRSRLLAAPHRIRPAKASGGEAMAAGFAGSAPLRTRGSRGRGGAAEPAGRRDRRSGRSRPATRGSRSRWPPSPCRPRAAPGWTTASRTPTSAPPSSTPGVRSSSGARWADGWRAASTARPGRRAPARASVPGSSCSSADAATRSTRSISPPPRRPTGPGSACASAAAEAWPRRCLRAPATGARSSPSPRVPRRAGRPSPATSPGGSRCRCSATALAGPTQRSSSRGRYHYAFVAEDGTWFVPESVPGRQDDGMGGHVAVLVVS